MTQYIDKSALAAEIERIKKEDYYDTHDEYDGFVRNALDKVLSFIDTLDVKDIEDSQSLEKEVAKGKNILILKKILSRVFESANANDEEFSKAIEDIENGLI